MRGIGERAIDHLDSVRWFVRDGLCVARRGYCGTEERLLRDLLRGVWV